ncbi:MAG: metalloregulator ArsR/SmtB family transcription factor [Paracoccaceae bacterium]
MAPDDDGDRRAGAFSDDMRATGFRGEPSQSTRFTDALTALGHPSRLAVFRLLMRHAPAGVRPSAIADALDMKPNTLSVHVSTLSRAGLVTSERRGRSVYYSVDVSTTGQLIRYLVLDCGRGRPELVSTLPWPVDLPLAEATGPEDETPVRVLFYCHGDCRLALVAAALANRRGPDWLVAHASGIEVIADAEADPAFRDWLSREALDMTDLQVEPMDHFLGADAPALDLVVTLSDRAANFDAPPFSGNPVAAHWNLHDPAAIGLPDAEPTVLARLRRRIDTLITLPIRDLGRLPLQRTLDTIAVAV